MLSTFFLVLCLCILPAPPSEGIAIALAREPYPPGYQPAVESPALFWLFREPPFEAARLHDPTIENPIFGRIPFGPAPGIPMVLLNGPETDGPFNLLLLDLNGDGTFGNDGAQITGRAARKAGDTTVWFDRIPLRAIEPDRPFESNPDALGEADQESWPAKTSKNCIGAVRIHYTAEKPVPRYGSFYTRCWMTGRVELKGVSYRLYLLDGDHNGRYTLEDRFALVPLEKESASPPPPTTADFHFLYEPVLTKKRPPYQVELDFGHTPRVLTLRVEGFNQVGDVVASDEMLLNAGQHRNHWDKYLPGYQFKLGWTQPIALGRKFVLQVTFESAWTERLVDEKVFTAGD